MEFDCKMCVHEKVCDLWLQQERQDASCFCLDGCDYFEPTLTQPNEWVSVEERLPEPGERVLATDCGFVGEFYINKRGKWQRYNVNCSELLMALDILYWMPLPAPPSRRPPEGDEKSERM